jgi:hypothetical protein
LRYDDTRERAGAPRRGPRRPRGAAGARPGYDDAAVERFASLIEERVREQLPARRENPTAVTVFSLVASIPLIAIAGSMGGLVGIALVCAALVLVNYFAYAASSRSPRR